MKKLQNSWVPRVLAVALIVAGMGVQGQTAFAASITQFSDNMSRLAENVNSNHEIIFASPSGVAAGQTITVTFSSDFTNVSTILFSDVDFATGSSSVCTSATYTEQTLAAAPSGATWGVVSAGQVITITSGSGTSTAGNCVRIRIGTNAVNQTTGVNQITNGALDDDDTITIGGTFGDTGIAAVDIIADDQVVITATIGPSISFAISDNTIGFGPLSIAASRFATGDTNGTGAETEAHTLTTATNATSGYVMYMSGPSLNNGVHFFDVDAANTAPAPAVEKFGVRFDESGGAGVVSAPYAAAGFAYDAVSAPDVIATAPSATDTTTYSARYVANIDTGTPSGNYSTTITYTATATF